MQVSHINSIPHKDNTFVKIVELTLAIVYSVFFGQLYYYTYPSLSYPTEYSVQFSSDA